MTATAPDSVRLRPSLRERLKVSPFTGLLSLFIVMSCHALDTNRLADVIYRIEGGPHTKWPYGIRCHRHTPLVARRMCINTVNNSYATWLDRGRPGDFLDFLADRYCPPSCDPVGNKNWKRNIRKVLKCTPTP